MGFEKRGSFRVPLAVSVAYRVGDQKRVDDYRVESVNISEGGIFLRTDLPLGIGTEVQLQFSLPGDSEALSISGEIVWSDAAPGSPGEGTGKGIRFTQCDDRFRIRLMEFVAGYHSS